MSKPRMAQTPEERAEQDAKRDRERVAATERKRNRRSREREARDMEKMTQTALKGKWITTWRDNYASLTGSEKIEVDNHLFDLKATNELMVEGADLINKNLGSLDGDDVAFLKLIFVEAVAMAELAEVRCGCKRMCNNPEVQTSVPHHISSFSNSS